MSAASKYDFFNFERIFKLNYVVYYQSIMSNCNNLNQLNMSLLEYKNDR